MLRFLPLPAKADLSLCSGFQQVQKGSVVAAGATVTPGKTVPSGEVRSSLLVRKFWRLRSSSSPQPNGASPCIPACWQSTNLPVQKSSALENKDRPASWTRAAKKRLEEAVSRS